MGWMQITSFCELHIYIYIIEYIFIQYTHIYIYLFSEYDLLCTWAVCGNLTSPLHRNFTVDSFVSQQSCLFSCVELRERISDS